MKVCSMRFSIVYCPREQSYGVAWTRCHMAGLYTVAAGCQSGGRAVPRRLCRRWANLIGLAWVLSMVGGQPDAVVGDSLHDDAGGDGNLHNDTGGGDTLHDDTGVVTPFNACRTSPGSW